MFITHPIASAANFKSLAQESKHPSIVCRAFGSGLGTKPARRRCGAAREDRQPSYFQPGKARSGDGGIAVAAAIRRASRILAVVVIVRVIVLEIKDY